MQCMKCNTGRFVYVYINAFVKDGRCSYKCIYQTPRKNQYSKDIWKNEFGYERVLEKYKKENFELLMDLDDWKKNIKSKVSKFPIKCFDSTVIRGNNRRSFHQF